MRDARVTHPPSHQKRSRKATFPPTAPRCTSLDSSYPYNNNLAHPAPTLSPFLADDEWVQLERVRLDRAVCHHEPPVEPDPDQLVAAPTEIGIAPTVVRLQHNQAERMSHSHMTNAW